MFTAAAFAVILVPDHGRSDAFGLIAARSLRDREPALARQHVGALAGLIVEGVGGAQEHVVTDLIQMAAVLEPWPRRRNMVGRGLALGLDEQRQFLEVLAIPPRKGLQQL